jgi:uncharacterized protein (TIGR02646 family)
MINQQHNPYNYSGVESTCIAAAGNNWKSQRNCIENLKTDLHTHFDLHQGEKCCYCGLLYDRTGRGEIDHIAPQGTYPDFSFTPTNLAKACQLCNSSTMKHTHDSIVNHSPNYIQCTFNIVHPYNDDHTYHYAWKYGIRRVVISVNNNSNKARESIRIFELASEKRTRARAIQKNQERIENIYQITDAIKRRIMSVIKPN